MLTAFVLILSACKYEAICQIGTLTSTIVVDSIIVRQGREDTRCRVILIASQILVLGSSIRIARPNRPVTNSALNLDDMNSKGQVIRVESPGVGIGIVGHIDSLERRLV